MHRLHRERLLGKRGFPSQLLIVLIRPRVSRLALSRNRPGPKDTQKTKRSTPMNGEITRTYGDRLAEQMAYLNRLVQETSGQQRVTLR